MNYMNNCFWLCYCYLHLSLCFSCLHYWMSHMSYMIAHSLLMSKDPFYPSLLLIFLSSASLPWSLAILSSFSKSIVISLVSIFQYDFSLCCSSLGSIISQPLHLSFWLLLPFQSVAMSRFFYVSFQATFLTQREFPIGLGYCSSNPLTLDWLFRCFLSIVSFFQLQLLSIYWLSFFPLALTDVLIWLLIFNSKI